MSEAPRVPLDLTIGSLFSGIGGLELGLERAGVGRTVWQVEKDEYCRAVLAKHWPGATRYEDVKDVGAHNLAAVDVLCGGFPCQDISLAGDGAGLAGERSGLWYEFARIVRELGPRYVVVENVAALLNRGFGDVLGTLANLGYDAEWSCVQACDVGAPHGRDRIFIVAYADSEPRRPEPQFAGRSGTRTRREPRRRAVSSLADNGGARRPRLEPASDPRPVGPWGLRGSADLQRIAADPFAPGPGWPQPLLRRMDDGLSGRMDRTRAIGNAVVPQVAEVVGQVIVALEAERSTPKSALSKPS